MPELSNEKKPLRIFMSYSHKDEEYKNDLDLHLANLKRQGLIEVWQDRKISPGDEWDEAIKQALLESDIVLFFVSPAFMASRYIWETELPGAFALRAQKKAVIVPIFVKPVDDADSPFAKLQGLPRDKKPLSGFADRDEGLYQIAKELRELVSNW